LADTSKDIKLPTYFQIQCYFTTQEIKYSIRKEFRLQISSKGHFEKNIFSWLGLFSDRFSLLNTHIIYHFFMSDDNNLFGTTNMRIKKALDFITASILFWVGVALMDDPTAMWNSNISTQTKSTVKRS